MVRTKPTMFSVPLPVVRYVGKFLLRSSLKWMGFTALVVVLDVLSVMIE